MKKNNLLIIICLLVCFTAMAGITNAAELFQSSWHWGWENDVNVLDTDADTSTRLWDPETVDIPTMDLATKSSDGTTGNLYRAQQDTLNIVIQDIAAESVLQDFNTGYRIVGLEYFESGGVGQLYSVGISGTDGKGYLTKYDIDAAGLITGVNSAVELISTHTGSPYPYGTSFDGLGWNPDLNALCTSFYWDPVGWGVFTVAFDGQYTLLASGGRYRDFAYQDGNLYAVRDASDIVRLNNLTGVVEESVMTLGLHAVGLSPTTTPGGTIPEPGTMGILLIGIAGIPFLRRRRS